MLCCGEIQLNIHELYELPGRGGTFYLWPVKGKKVLIIWNWGRDWLPRKILIMTCFKLIPFNSIKAPLNSLFFHKLSCSTSYSISIA